MKKLISKIAIFVVLFASFVLPGTSQAFTTWDTTGSYVVGFQLTGDPAVYSHDMNLSQDGSDNLSGGGGHPAGSPFTFAWAITSGTVVNNTVTITADYTLGAVGTTMHMTGTIASNGTISGIWDDNYGGGLRTGTWSTTSGNAVEDTMAPVVSSVLVAPAPPVAGFPTTLTANIDDTTTGNSNIASAEYRITGDSSWTAMNAVDAFNSPNENVTVNITFTTPGIKEVCVRGTDAGNNTSTPSGDDCTIVNVIDPLTGYVAGGGNIKSGKKVVTTFGGNVGYVPDVGLVGQIQVVDHELKTTCHYDIINSLTVVGGLATVNASGKCNTATLTYKDNGEPGTTDLFNNIQLAGGNIQVGGETIGVKTFTATDSAYYNGMSVSDGLYGTGPFTFTWDAVGNVTGGLWEEIVPAVTGTHYFNIVTGGTVSSGGAVNLTLLRTNPSNYGPFTIVGTLTGGVLTGTAAGPYLFTATGTVTP
jgi:hypothetical protein